RTSPLVFVAARRPPLATLKKLPHSIGLCGEAYPHSSEASRGEDLDIEEPVSGWDYATLHFHATLPGMLGSSLIWHQIVQVSEASKKRLLAAAGMMESLHRE